MQIENDNKRKLKLGKFSNRLAYTRAIQFGFNTHTITHTQKQRWASTLANWSNARHRSHIRAPPTPPPHRCMYPKCGNLCGQRVRKRFIAS
jgi:hypothetical protein